MSSSGIDSEEEGEEWWGEDDSEDEENDEDRILAMGEEAKEEVRSQLREMKAVYRSIIQRNLELPEQFQIPEKDLKLPPEIYAHIENKIFEDCDEVFRIHEYESAETIIQLDKIRKFYFDPILTPHIVLKDITHEIQVMSIRNKKITDAFKELFEATAAAVEEETRLMRERAMRADTQDSVELPPIERIYAEDIIGEYKSKLHRYDVETVHNIRHLEKRLEQRYHREVAWQKLMSEKIGADYIAPEDEKELQKAKDSSGVFRLQNSDNFLGEQISMAERRQRIINMKVKMRQKVQEFNTLLLEARDEKPQVLKECRRLEQEIKKIHVLLPEEYRRQIPKMYDMELDETPEKALDITVEEVQKEEGAMLEEAELTGIGAEIMEKYFGVKKPEKPPYLMDEEANRTLPVPPPAATAARQAKNIDLENESVASHRCRKAHFNPQTEMEKKRFEALFYPRIYRQEALFKELFGVLNYFHERVKYLYDRRVQLEIESKVQAVGLITSICELDVTKEFQAHEDSIIERLQAQQAESRNVKGHMEIIQKGMNKENTDIKKLENEIAKLTKEAEGIIKGRFSKYLWKVFRRKKKKPLPEFLDEDGEIIEGAEIDYSQIASEMSDDDEDEKEKYDLEVCPETLEKHVYNRVCDLRAAKYKLEDSITEHTETLSQLSADHDEVESVYLKYEARIVEINEEIRVLQRRRQKRMNDLKLMIILRADQIQCMDMEELMDLEGDVLEKLAQSYPGSSHMVIFPKNGSEELKRRQSELIRNAKSEKERCKLGKKMVVRIREELKKGEWKVLQIKEKAKQDMISKFGQEIDLDKMAAAVINLELIDEQQNLDQMKKEHYRERRMIGKEVDKVRYGLTKTVKDNSKFNMMKAMMMERRRDIEYYIWKNEKNNSSGLKRVLESTNNATEMTKQLEHIISNEKSANTSKESKDSSSKDDSTASKESSKLLEEEIQQVRTVLTTQNSRITELKTVLEKYRGKTGLPPLAPLCQRISLDKLRRSQSGKKAPKHGKFMKPAKELPELNQYCQPVTLLCGVETIYKDDKMNLAKNKSWTRPSLENIDKEAEAATDRIFGSSSAYLDDDIFEEEEAMDDLGRTIEEFFPDEEEQEEFLQYMGSAEVFEDVDELMRKDQDADDNVPSTDPAKASHDDSHVKFPEADKEKDVRVFETPKPKAGLRKSYVATEPKTEEEVLAKVRRFSLKSKKAPELQDDFEAIAKSKEMIEAKKAKEADQDDEDET